MLGILDRYLFREVMQSSLFITGILLFIQLSNTFALYLGDAAAGRLPRDVVFSLLGYSTVSLLMVTIPLGLFLAIMLVLGRLYGNSEMAAITSCGLGPSRLYRPLMLLTILLAALVTWLSLEAGPWSARKIHQARATAHKQVEIGILEPGSFRQAGDDIVFYAEELGKGGVLRRVFLQRQEEERVEVVVAATGETVVDAEGERTMVLHDGRRYEGVPGTREFRITEFAEHGIPIPSPSVEDASESDPHFASFAALFGSAQPAFVAERQWRISLPLSLLVLAFLALPLARVQPRQGQYGKFISAILVYLVYGNLLSLSRSAVERGNLSPLLGLWWVHVALLVVAGALLVRQYGWPWHIPPRRSVAQAVTA